MKLEVLKQLTPSSPTYNSVARSTGEDFSPLDVAAALGMMHCTDAAIEYVRIKYTKSPEEQADIIASRKIQDELAEIVKIEQSMWPESRKKWPESKIDLLCDIAVRAELLPNRCHSCNGVQHINGIDCHVCNGTGLQKDTDTQKAQRLGVARQNYTKTWRDREMELRLILCAWEVMVNDEMAWKMSLKELNWSLLGGGNKVKTNVQWERGK